MANMKPCPFCQSTAATYRGEGNGRCAVKCNSCHAVGPVSEAGMGGALHAWNERGDELAADLSDPRGMKRVAGPAKFAAAAEAARERMVHTLSRCVCGSGKLEVLTEEGESIIACKNCGRLVDSPNTGESAFRWNRGDNVAAQPEKVTAKSLAVG